jgi:hypothetical protein
MATAPANQRGEVPHARLQVVFLPAQPFDRHPVSGHAEAAAHEFDERKLVSTGAGTTKHHPLHTGCRCRLISCGGAPPPLYRRGEGALSSVGCEVEGNRMAGWPFPSHRQITAKFCLDGSGGVPGGGAKLCGGGGTTELPMANKLYVGNLSGGTTGPNLGQLFAQHGAVDSAEVICDSKTGESKRFGFVQMASA